MRLVEAGAARDRWKGNGVPRDRPPVAAQPVRQNMIIDQSEIDALLTQAEGLAAETRVEAARPAPVVVDSPPMRSAPADLERLLQLRVPLIVQLATRQMEIVAVRELSVGAIIEFEKPVEDPLDLLVNNRRIGRGVCVKVGENFGLRVTEICTRAERVRSMGQG